MACSKRINCSSSCPIRDLPPNYNCYNGHEIDVRRRGLSRLGKRLKNKVRKYVFNKLNNPIHEGHGGPVEVPCIQCHAEAHQWYLGEVQQHAEAYHYASLNELKMIEADLEREINELYEINTNFNTGHEAFEKRLEALSESMIKNREKTEATLQGVFQGLNSIWHKYKKIKTKSRHGKSRKNSSRVKETTSTQTVATHSFNRSQKSYGRGENKNLYEVKNQPKSKSTVGRNNARGRTIFTMRENGNNTTQVNPIWNQLSKSDKEDLYAKKEHSAGRSTTSALVSTNHDTDSFQDMYRLKKGKPKIKRRAEGDRKQPSRNNLPPKESCSPTEEQDRGILTLIKNRLKEAVGIVDEMNGYLEIINESSKQKETEQEVNKAKESEKSEETDKSSSQAMLKTQTEKSVKKKKNRENYDPSGQNKAKGRGDKSPGRNKSSNSNQTDEDSKATEGPAKKKEKIREKVSEELEESDKVKKCQQKETNYQCDNENNSSKKKTSIPYLSRFDIEVKSGKEITRWKINTGDEEVILHLKKDKVDQNKNENDVIPEVLVEASSDEESTVTSFYSHVLRERRSPVEKDRLKNYIHSFMHEEYPLKKHNWEEKIQKPSRRVKDRKRKSADRKPLNRVRHGRKQKWNTDTLSWPSSARKSTSETGRTLRSSELKPKDAFASSSRGQTFIIDETFDNSKINTSDESYIKHGKQRQFDVPSSAYDSMNDSEMYFKNVYVKSFSN